MANAVAPKKAVNYLEVFSAIQADYNKVKSVNSAKAMDSDSTIKATAMKAAAIKTFSPVKAIKVIRVG